MQMWCCTLTCSNRVVPLHGLVTCSNSLVAGHAKTDIYHYTAWESWHLLPVMFCQNIWNLNDSERNCQISGSKCRNLPTIVLGWQIWQAGNGLHWSQWSQSQSDQNYVNSCIFMSLTQQSHQVFTMKSTNKFQMPLGKFRIAISACRSDREEERKYAF